MSFDTAPSTTRDRFSKRLLEALARPFLWLTTTAIPVFIAACYGPAVEYGCSGKVIDKSTKAGVAGIKVSCIVDGNEQWSETTDQYGIFKPRSDCDSIATEASVDAGTSGYKPSTKNVDGVSCSDWTIEVEPN